MKAKLIGSSSHAAAVAQQPRLNLQILLEEAAREFLDAKTPLGRKRYIWSLQYSMQDLLAAFGHVPLANITSPMIQQALFARKRGSYTNKVVLGCIKVLFHWACARGYLAPGPTAADSIRVQVPPPAPRLIIHPDELQALLGGDVEVELRLAIALWSFAGLNNLQLNRQQWKHVVPGRAILLPRKNGVAAAKRITPVLNDWLLPFYGCPGAVVSHEYLPGQCHQHARMLGIRATPSVLHRSWLAYSRLLSGPGAKVSLFRNGLGAPTASQAQEFFALTPEKVGLTNWPGLVAEYLANGHKRHTRQVGQ